jgi:hypothetical protein
MFRQYHAQRFQLSFPPIAKRVGGKILYCADSRDRELGTIPIGTILYIQDNVSPVNGFRSPIIRKEPWMVEAWIPRDHARWDANSRRLVSVRIRGGHLAVVRSLRHCKRTKVVADWILHACADAGLEKSS